MRIARTGEGVTYRHRERTSTRCAKNSAHEGERCLNRTGAAQGRVAKTGSDAIDDHEVPLLLALLNQQIPAFDQLIGPESADGGLPAVDGDAALAE